MVKYFLANQRQKDQGRIQKKIDTSVVNNFIRGMSNTFNLIFLKKTSIADNKILKSDGGKSNQVSINNEDLKMTIEDFTKKETSLRIVSSEFVVLILFSILNRAQLLQASQVFKEIDWTWPS